MTIWRHFRQQSFHQLVNRFAGAILLILAALYSVPSESSIALDRATAGLFSVTNLSVLFALCGAALLVRRWRPFRAILFTLPAFTLGVFNSYFLFRMLFDAYRTGEFSVLIRPVWPPPYYFGFVLLFWLCKLYEYTHAAPTAAR